MNRTYWYRWDRSDDSLHRLNAEEFITEVLKAALFGGTSNRVADSGVRGIRVSTVFLAGEPHVAGEEALPFETLVSAEDATLDGLTWRYRGAAAARKGHAEIVRRLEARESLSDLELDEHADCAITCDNCGRTLYDSGDNQLTCPCGYPPRIVDGTLTGGEYVP